MPEFQQITFENIVEILVEEDPALGPLLKNHLDHQFGKLLQHVFFGDLTRYVEQRMHGGKVDLDVVEEVKKILAVLERAVSTGDRDLIDLVGASFSEMLDQSQKSYKSLKSLMGPNLLRILKPFEWQQEENKV